MLDTKILPSRNATSLVYHTPNIQMYQDNVVDQSANGQVCDPAGLGQIGRSSWKLVYPSPAKGKSRYKGLYKSHIKIIHSPEPKLSTYFCLHFNSQLLRWVKPVVFQIILQRQTYVQMFYIVRKSSCEFWLHKL